MGKNSAKGGRDKEKGGLPGRGNNIYKKVREIRERTQWVRGHGVVQ